MTEAAAQMKNVVFEVMDKYAFLEEYVNAPSVLTGKGIPIFIKYMSTILYLRRRLGFLVVPDDETFYHKIEDNDYTQFASIDDVEIYKILVAFVIFACAHITDKVQDDDESLDKILPNIRKYIYKNLDFVVPELA
jgi:hypothetical protein